MDWNSFWSGFGGAISGAVVVWRVVALFVRSTAHEVSRKEIRDHDKETLRPWLESELKRLPTAIISTIGEQYVRRDEIREIRDRLERVEKWNHLRASGAAGD